MISRVPGYGQFEYLVFELLVDLITLFNEIVGFINDLVILGQSWGYLLNMGNFNLVVNRIYSFVVGKKQLYAKLNLEPPPAKYAYRDRHSHYYYMVWICQYIQCTGKFTPQDNDE